MFPFIQNFSSVKTFPKVEFLGFNEDFRHYQQESVPNETHSPLVIAFSSLSGKKPGKIKSPSLPSPHHYSPVIEWARIIYPVSFNKD